jgi:hypothetical protein
MGSTLNLPVIKQGLMQKSNEQLIDILSFNQGDYQPDVIIVIKEILSERGTSEHDIQLADDKYKSIITSKNVDLNYKRPKDKWGKRAIYLLWGIPLYLLGYYTVYFVNKINHHIYEHKIYQHKVWDSSYTVKYYNIAKQVADSTFDDNTAKKEFTNLLINGLKTKFPMGLDSSKYDSLNSKITLFTQECLSKAYKDHPNSLRRKKNL